MVESNGREPVYDYDLFFLILIFVIIWIGAPISVGIAWWLWARSERSAAQGWRNRALLIGILAGSLNVVINYSWILYALSTKVSPSVWRIKDISGDIGVFLSFVALGGAILGTGVPRVPLGVCALLGVCMWTSFAV